MQEIGEIKLLNYPPGGTRFTKFNFGGCDEEMVSGEMLKFWWKLFGGFKSVK